MFKLLQFIELFIAEIPPFAFDDRNCKVEIDSSNTETVNVTSVNLEESVVFQDEEEHILESE